MSHSPRKTGKEKGRAQSAKICAALLISAPTQKPEQLDYKTISGDTLPSCLLKVAKGHIECEMLRIVYQHPFINTFQMQDKLGVSNAAQHSRQLNKKLFKLGYQIAKFPLKGHNRFWLWALQKEVSSNDR
ncbi:hypothetical protein [Shewanella fodinae]|uniref:Helix-turn-helix protein n=1 Tax=Shewanella fodinae TaxID=552357 RepID=A0A4R2FF45_9GAMM|nr:hypothetical protein [Shewanella fodinae]TCN87873.1 hypothetical protein EDC91_1044 [Shewanella fodinae]